MKRLSQFTPAIVLAALALVLTLSANAQTTSMRVDIPFQFVAGDVVLPAGQYFIRFDPAGHYLRLDSLAHVQTAQVPVIRGIAGRNADRETPGMLRFAKYGEMHALRAVWRGGQADGHLLPISKAEREMLARGAGAEVTDLTLY